VIAEIKAIRFQCHGKVVRGTLLTKPIQESFDFCGIWNAKGNLVLKTHICSMAEAIYWLATADTLRLAIPAQAQTKGTGTFIVEAISG
jgi:hypothetical protein